MSKIHTKINALRAIAEKNPIGDGVANQCIANAADDIEALLTRINALEKESMAFRSIAEMPLTAHPDSNPDYVAGFNSAIRLLEDIYLGEPHHALKHFAVQQKIDAINHILELGKCYTIADIDQWQIDDEDIENYIAKLKESTRHQPTTYNLEKNND